MFSENSGFFISNRSHCLVSLLTFVFIVCDIWMATDLAAGIVMQPTHKWKTNAKVDMIEYTIWTMNKPGKWIEWFVKW